MKWRHGVCEKHQRNGGNDGIMAASAQYRNGVVSAA